MAEPSKILNRKWFKVCVDAQGPGAAPSAERIADRQRLWDHDKALRELVADLIEVYDALLVEARPEMDRQCIVEFPDITAVIERAKAITNG